MLQLFDRDQETIYCKSIIKLWI